MEFSEKAANEGKIVIISALDATYLRTGFDNILQLIPRAEKVKKLTSICRGCNKNASFTFRTIDTEQLELIGSEESYMPLCRTCFVTAESQMNEKRKKNEGDCSALTTGSGEPKHFQQTSPLGSGASSEGSEGKSSFSTQRFEI